MSGFTPPPPGSLPPGAASPDMQSAMQDMMAAKTSSHGKGKTPGASAVSSMMKGKGAHGKSTSGHINPAEEAKQIARDVGTSFTEFLPTELQFLAGKKNESPEEAAKRQQMLQRFQQLSAEDRQFVQKKFHEQQMEKRKREQEEQVRRQQMAAQQSNEVAVPQGKVRGDAQGKSQKQQTVSKLQNDRKKLSNAG